MTKKKRKGDWQQSYTGRAFWPIDPREEDVDIRDIAHALAQQCRFGGHTKFHYSIAQHSVLVMKLLARQAHSIRLGGKPIHPLELQLTGLLHDASEAYIVDVPRPLKVELSEYYGYEDAWNSVIAKRFKLLWPWPKDVKEADATALAIERDALFSKPPKAWKKLPTLPTPRARMRNVRQMTPAEAEEQFLDAFYDLAARMNVRL